MSGIFNQGNYRLNQKQKRQFVVAVSNDSRQLNLLDLDSLRYEVGDPLPPGYLTLDLLRYYTSLQIEMFGLRDRCCVLPFDNDAVHTSFMNIHENDGESRNLSLLANGLRRMRNSNYVIGAWNTKFNHFVSVVSCNVCILVFIFYVRVHTNICGCVTFN